MRGTGGRKRARRPGKAAARLRPGRARRRLIVPGVSFSDKESRVSTRHLVLVVLAGVALAMLVSLRGSAQTQVREPAPVLVENRGVTQAVPVTVLNQTLAVHTDRVPLDVAIREPLVLPIAVTSQQWSYLEIRYQAGQSPLPLLQAAGRDGWEAAGVMYQLPSESAILMKRPMR